jgi:hypothetical protein
MVDAHFPKLVFKYPFDEAAAYEADARGYLAYAVVELSDGARYPIVFYDPIRLQDDLEVEIGEGRPFIAEPGMIVVPEVTLARMQDAVDRLFRSGFFHSLRTEAERRPRGGQGEGNGSELRAGGENEAARPSHPDPVPNP